MVCFVIPTTVSTMFNNRFIQTYRGIRAGWQTIAIRPAAEAEAMVARLRLDQPQLIHRCW